MASGILGGGELQANTTKYAYTTPSGQTTTASLLLFNGPTAGAVYLYLGPVTFPVNVPAKGMVNMSGIVLAAGQSVSLKADSGGLSYLLTGWESTV